MEKLSLSERLRIARQRKGWTQDELARQLNVDKSTVSRHESGKLKTLDVGFLLRVAEAVGVDPRWIIGPSERASMVNESEREYGELSAREKELVERWRALGELDRRYIEGFLAAKTGEEKRGEEEDE